MKHTSEEIKNRLSNIGEAIGNIALDYITELEKENAELKCECRRCVYTDCPCVLSDYEKDRNGICDHFKDVLDENAELKEALEGYKKIAKWCDKCDKIAELKSENQKWKDGIALKDEEIGCIETEFNTFKSEAKEIIERLLITSCNSDVLNLLPNCSEVLRVRVEAEQFISEVEK